MSIVKLTNYVERAYNASKDGEARLKCAHVLEAVYQRIYMSDSANPEFRPYPAEILALDMQALRYCCDYLNISEPRR